MPDRQVTIAVDQFARDRWVVSVSRTEYDDVVTLPPFRTQAWASTAATTLALAYRSDGYNVVEEATP